MFIVPLFERNPTYLAAFSNHLKQRWRKAMPLLLPVLIGIPVVLGGTWMIYTFAK
jgi:hypothetical protein